MTAIENQAGVPIYDANSYKYIVIGGGIAGVTCAETVGFIKR